MGLLHGYISLFSLIASPLPPVRIYQFPNSGILYDISFIVGILTFYGSVRRTYAYTSGLWRG